MKTIYLNGKNLTPRDLYRIAVGNSASVKIDFASFTDVERAKKFLDKCLYDKIIYGVNTGFGPMASYVIDENGLYALQHNLVRSHATGAGHPIKLEYVIASMVIRLNTLLRGFSGVSVALIRRLEVFINKRIVPIIPEHGGVGASGDLVQLAHVALALIGEGEVFYQNRMRNTGEVLRELRLPIKYKLSPKEGLSLMNGTSVMAGISALLYIQCEQIFDLSVKAGAFALELTQAYDDSISKKLHDLRPHSGQKEVSDRLRKILSCSKLLRNRSTVSERRVKVDKQREIHGDIQEIYSLRCAPQILGPVYDTLVYSKKILDVEINSVTDNPIVDWKQRRFIHGGNFHGDYVASAIDYLKIAIIRTIMLSERRINFFLNSKLNKRFPPFLNLRVAGLNLGLQGLQFVATSTSAQSQTYAYPQHIHSIPTNADNQDIISLGTDAALIAAKIVENAFTVLAIELIVLSQAADSIGGIEKFSTQVKMLYNMVRTVSSRVTDDRPLFREINSLIKLLKP